MISKLRTIAAMILIAAVLLAAAVNTAFAAQYMLGDTDGDGKVTILDATRIQRKLADLSVSGTFDDAAADVNRSGTVDILDVTVIQRWLASFDVPTPVGTLIEAPTEPPTDSEGWGRDILRP